MAGGHGRGEAVCVPHAESVFPDGESRRHPRLGRDRAGDPARPGRTCGRSVGAASRGGDPAAAGGHAVAVVGRGPGQHGRVQRDPAAQRDRLPVLMTLHQWFIEEREYARQHSRRGKRHAFEAVSPRRTALVVIDMVPFFVTDSDYCQGIVPNIALLAESLRGAGGLVAWVLPGAGPPSAVADEFYGPEVAEMFRRSGGEGPLEARLWHEFEVHEGDLLVEKTATSAFFPGRCPLPDLLRSRGIDTVLITGTVTNVCCESSARDASTLG